MQRMFLAVDIGTTHVKAIAFDSSGNIRAIEKVENTLNAKGFYSAQEVFQRVNKVIRACRLTSPCAIGLTGMADCGLLVDKQGDPLTDVLPWSAATGFEQQTQLLETYSLKQLYHITGQTLHPKFALVRLMHLRQTLPETFAQASYWLSLQDYILFCLTGEYKTDESLATRTMLFDIEKHTWHRELCAFCGIGERLPQVVRTGSRAGAIGKKASMTTGLREGCPVYACGHDHLCALFAINQLMGSRMINSMGTSEVFAGMLEKRLGDEGVLLGINQGLHRLQGYYWLANLPSSGASISWLKSISGQADYRFLVDNPADDAGGVSYFPFINGSGVPDPDPHRRGAFLGLSSQTTVFQLAYAMYEGIAFETKRIFEAFERLTDQQIGHIACVGGSTQNPAMVRVRADRTGMMMDLLDISELTALGAVMMTAQEQGEAMHPPLTYQTIVPSEGCPAKFDDSYYAYKELCGILYGKNKG